MTSITDATLDAEQALAAHPAARGAGRTGIEPAQLRGNDRREALTLSSQPREMMIFSFIVSGLVCSLRLQIPTRMGGDGNLDIGYSARAMRESELTRPANR